MKAWAKRMIWFFGLKITGILNEYVNYLRDIPNIELDYLSALILLGIYFIPMLMMKDD